MKRPILTFALLFAVIAVKSQQTYTTVTDAPHYYFNKQYFKTGVSVNNFPFYT